MLAELNRTLEQAQKQLNELLRLAQMSGEEIYRFHNLERRIQEVRNDPDVEKAAAELEQLNAALNELGQRLNYERQDVIIYLKEFRRIQENISALNRMTEQLSQVNQDLESQYQDLQSRYQRLSAQYADLARQIAGDPTIPPSLLHIFKQSLEELNNHLDVLRKMLNSELHSDLNLEIKNEIWENTLRLSKAAEAASKWMGIDINEFPFNEFLKRYGSYVGVPYNYPYPYPYPYPFHHPEYFYRILPEIIPEYFEKPRLRTEKSQNLLGLYLVSELYARYISVWLKKEYYSLPNDIEWPAEAFDYRYLYRHLRNMSEVISWFLSSVENH